ncbi:MAG TPA: hypothetical protein VHO95_12360 [Candidatus Dormibacteraeota bacterium]|nr:hypothetical protein [Candidatus Dormibacteraeota bacterium]HEX2679917.1 hypothetical protein [Candidatus Dormibacteraeota bacterium]
MAINDPGRIVVNPVLRYFYSSKNIVGSTLGLFGLLLFFTHIITSFFWPFVVVAMYGIGALLAPGPPKVALSGTSFDPESIRHSLQRTLSIANGKLSPPLQGKLQDIADTIMGILPHYADFPPGSPDLFVVGRTATDYLPSALQAYLNLPRAYAALHKMPNGKTADDVLGDQLTLLASKMNEVADAVHKKDSDALLANGRFLEEKFGASPLGLPQPTT